VLTEFDRLAPSLGFECELLDPTTVVARSPAACPDGLLGGLASDTEMCVDPREIISRMPRWLHDEHGVELHFGVPIERTGKGVVAAADGALWNVDRVVIAAGADFRLLYPDLYAEAGFRRCKLQMMRTVPQPGGWELGPMLAGGLTLRHYHAFRVCQNLAALERRIETESPELNRYGIHVMASQNGSGEVILGDSHEYDEQITPFDKALIDELIFREIRRIADLPDWTIHERWHGIYPVTPNGIEFVAEPEPNVHLAIASGGCGMTMSFGLADEKWLAWDGPAPADEPALPFEKPSTHGKVAAPA
jgi:FAD dependent oxidoreductase TIGR03364